MKSLKNIQILCKIARIIFLILFIASIIGAVGCIVGMIVLKPASAIVVDGKSVEEMLLEGGVSLPLAYAGMAGGLVGCLASIFIFKYNEMFFVKELEVGTPFTFEMVKLMRKNALVNIIVSLATSIVIVIVVSIVLTVNGASYKFDGTGFSTVAYGLVLLIISMFCQYGAEVSQNNNQSNDQQ